MSKTQLPDFERRYLEMTVRAAGDGQNPVIEGDAAVFNVETVVGRWFREKILPGAFTRVLSESPDVIGAFNHDWNFVLGRTTANTMKLEQTDKGLRYVIDVNPNDTQAMSIYEKVKRGDVSQSSFAFTVAKETWSEPVGNSETLALREIVEVGKLFDVGPVPFAQYPEASAQARSKSESFQSPLPPQAAPGGAEDEIRLRQKSMRRRFDLIEKSIYSK